MTDCNDTRCSKPAAKDSTAVFGIQSVVIDGQCFYRLLDKQLNKALNGQFQFLKSLANKPQLPPSQSDQNRPITSHLANPNEHCSDGVARKRLQQLHDNVDPKPLRLKTSTLHSNDMIDNDLPWTRGNPQPKNGKRGTLGWSLGQRSQQLDPNLFHKPSNNWINDSLQFISKRPDNLYQTASQEAYSFLEPPKPVDYPPYLTNSYNTLYPETYNNYINPFSYGTSPEQQKRYEKEQHRLDLIRQIEDNNRRKMMRKHQEWEEDQREKWRSERTLQRQREEVEKEQKEIRERQLAAELKAQRANYNLPFERNENVRHQPRNFSKQGARKDTSASSKATSRLEWWEKKPSWQERRISSPVIPALRGDKEDDMRNKMRVSSKQSRTENNSSIEYPESQASRRSASIKQLSERPVSLQSRQSRSSSRRSYQPSLVSRAGSGPSGLRNLSDTQKRLEDEYKKVRSAVNKKQYDSRVFH